MTRPALAALIITALGALACPPMDARSYHHYTVSNPDDQLAAMASTCRATPTTCTTSLALECVSDACIAVCKHLMVIGGDAAHQDQLTDCLVTFPADGGDAITAYVAFEPKT